MLPSLGPRGREGFDEEGAPAARDAGQHDRRGDRPVQTEASDEVFRHDLDAPLLDREGPDTPRAEGGAQRLLAEREFLQDREAPRERRRDCSVRRHVREVRVGQAAPDAGVAVTPPLVEFDAGAPPVEPVDAGAAEPPDAAVPEPVEVRAAVVSVSAPTPVEVSVDGKKYGKTPIDLELTPGKHRIVAGAKSWAVDLEPGATIDLKVSAGGTAATPPKEKEKGTLKVEASPFCQLSVDGKGQGTVSFKELELSAGPHTVQCTLEDPSLPAPRVKKQKVQVKPGAQAEVKFNMLLE